METKIVLRGLHEGRELWRVVQLREAVCGGERDLFALWSDTGECFGIFQEPPTDAECWKRLLLDNPLQVVGAEVVYPEIIG